MASMMVIYRAIIHILPGNLFDLMISSFQENCHHVTCNLAYIMGDIMALIACNIWKINNMVESIQANRTGAPMGASVKGDHAIKKKMYESKMWPHNTQLLVAAVWSDNYLVEILSNYHQPEIIHAGMMRRKIGDGTREKYQSLSLVNALMQNDDYCDTYYQIISPIK